MQFGNFMANKPFMDQSLAMLQKMTGSGGGSDGMTSGGAGANYITQNRYGFNSAL